MNRIKEAFANGTAFIPFVTAGDPDLETTGKLVLEMAKAGADLIELGIPFSDPVAEGEVIQRADSRALSGGCTIDGIFHLVRSIRGACGVPLAFMTYVNPVYVYGPEKFLKHCASCGVDAVIVPDLPFEEKKELLPFCDANRVELISMIAPTSHQRIEEIAKEARGFVYCVSSLGVTGVRKKITSDVGTMISLVKRQQKIPCAVGFGISTPEQAEKIAQVADGVIVGSAIVKLVEQYGADCLGPVSKYVREMKQAVRTR
ncbi:MAG: tryptophan synthase subunit alpha [Oscillospiraceae bacterium]|nr:tryptophan synthase subunit alpha [Oscillospiraceae bacterium]